MLLPATSYDFFVEGINGNGVTSLPSTVTTFVTASGTPKQISSQDINNIQCTPTVNNATNRVNIKCTWNKASPAPPNVLLGVEIKCRCSSLIREAVSIRKDFNASTAPTATSVTFQINRDVATCNIYLKGIFGVSKTGKHHSGVRHLVTVVVGV